MNTTYTVKLVSRIGCTKTLHAGLSENNARCIVAELNRLDKKGKFEYRIEQVKI